MIPTWVRNEEGLLGQGRREQHLKRRNRSMCKKRRGLCRLIQGKECQLSGDSGKVRTNVVVLGMVGQE